LSQGCIPRRHPPPLQRSLARRLSPLPRLAHPISLAMAMAGAQVLVSPIQTLLQHLLPRPPPSLPPSRVTQSSYVTGCRVDTSRLCVLRKAAAPIFRQISLHTRGHCHTSLMKSKGTACMMSTRPPLKVLSISGTAWFERTTTLQSRSRNHLSPTPRMDQTKAVNSIGVQFRKMRLLR
jgi:hypothetical protein